MTGFYVSRCGPTNSDLTPLSSTASVNYAKIFSLAAADLSGERGNTLVEGRGVRRTLPAAHPITRSLSEGVFSMHSENRMSAHATKGVQFVEVERVLPHSTHPGLG